MSEYTPAQNKALTLGKSICVTAGAGTGKTFLLTKRYLELLKTGCFPKDIVALTYTEKAAAEMQTKISRELKEQSEKNPHLKDCFETFSQGTISTFHGFCLAILKEFAYEAGLDPGFSVMDELDNTELVNHTIKEVIENPPETLFESLVHLHVHLSQEVISDAIRQLAASGHETEQWFAELKESPETIQKLWCDAYKKTLIEEGVSAENPFFEAIDTMPETDYLLCLKEWFFTDPINSRLVNRLKMADAGDIKKGREKYLTIIHQLEAAKTPEEIRFVCASAAVSKVDGTKKFPVSEEETRRAAEFVKIFQSLSWLPGIESTVFSHTRRLLLELYEAAAKCKERIRQEKRHAGVLDFDDLIEKTDELLSDAHPEILAAVSSRCRYVMVDEVQDNDPKLIRLVKKLCGSPKENDRLFIVGDAKQSIYLFRNADVAGFQGFLCEFPEEPAALDTSFRSTPEIIGFVNSLFAEIFKSRTNPWDPPYDPIVPYRQHEQGGVETILLPYPEKKADLRKIEAEALASWIYDAVVYRKLPVYAGSTTRPAEFSDVAVLLEKRTYLPALRAALEKYHIPYAEEGGKDFYGRQETKDVWAVLSAVLYPEDDIPLYGALRSPYFAIPDAELCKAADAKQGTLFSRLSRFTAENPDNRIAHALESLSRWKDAAKHLPPAECFEKIITESEILSIYAGIPGGDRMEANLIKLLDILRGRAASMPFSLHEFVSLLETSMDETFSESEGEPIDERGNRVRIITVHSSKGLEYPIVCVAFAGSSRNSSMPQFILDDRFGAGISIHLPWMTKKGEKKKRFGILQQILQNEQKEKEAAEHKRLFYVACTRARDYLVLCGSQENKDGYPDSSFMALYNNAKSALQDEPKIYDSALCPPPDSDTQEMVVPEAELFSLPKEEEEVISVSYEEAFAMRRGTLLHEIFAGADATDAGRRVRLFSDAEKFSQLYETFLASPIMQDVVRSWCEMPVLCGGERRVIDRFVEYENGSFAVIDYKTGNLAKAEESGRFVQYQKQVSEYVALMSEIVGADVSGWLYFAEEDRWIQV